jgi:hypothetical protein
VGFVGIAACIVFLYVSWVSGRDDRYQRARQGIFGFAAWTALCVARIILLKPDPASRLVGGRKRPQHRP